MRLPDEAQLGAVVERNRGRVDAGGRQEVAPLGLHFGEKRCDGGPRGGIKAGVVAAHEVETDRRGEKADGRPDAGTVRHDDLAASKEASDAGGVDGAGTAEGEERHGGGVLPAFDGVHPRGGGHGLVDDLMDGPRAAGGIEAGRGADVRGDGTTGGVEVEGHRATKEVPGVEIAKHQVGVGDGGHRGAAPVAGRPGVGAGAIWPHLDEAEAVDPRDAAATGTDLDQVDAWHAYRQAAPGLEPVDAVDLELGGDRGDASGDEAGLGGRAAHIKREKVWAAGGSTVRGGGECPGGRAGLDEADGEASRGIHGGGAPARQH